MPQIHILDGQEGTILDYITAKNIISDNHKKSLEDTLETYDFITFADKRFSQYLEKRNRIIIPDEDGSLVEFVIFEAARYKDTEGYKSQVYTNASYLELKKATILYPDNGFTGTASQHGGRALNNTGWQVGIVEGSSTRTLSISKHTNPYEFLKRIAREFKLELRFRVEHDGNKITGRYVDLLERVGQWRGREVEFGKDLDGIRRVEKQDIVTALLGLGPEDEDGNRLEILVEDEDALKRWGRVDEYGNLHHLIEPYEIQSERQEMTETEARQYTRTALNKRINTQVTYETTIVDLENVPGMENKKIRYGDTIRIKDTNFNPPLYLEARVFEQTRSIKSKAKKDIKLGDYVEFTEEEVNDVWNQLRDEIRNRITAAELAEYTYNKLTIDNKDEQVYEDGKTFAEATGIEAKEHADFKADEAENNAKGYADEQDELLRADVEDYADGVAESALSSAKQYAVAKEVYENEMNKIASDIEDRAPLEYVDGKFTTIDDDLDDFNAELNKKADGSTVYTIEDVDNMINNTVSKTQYTEDMGGVVSDIESHGTRIGQNEEAIGFKADESYVDTVESQLETKIGNVEVTAEGASMTASEVRADLDGLEIGGRNLILDSKSRTLEPTDSSGYNYTRLALTENLDDGTKYTVTAEVEFTDGNSDVISILQRKNDNDGNGNVNDDSKVKNGKIKETFKTTNGDTNMLLFYAGRRGETQNIGVIFRNIKLERGNKATDWSPAPEDTDEAISGVSGRVETLDGEISTLAGEVSLKASQSSVDSLEGRVEDAEGEISVLPGQIELKADAAVVDGIDDRLGSAEIVIDGLESEIALKADVVDIEGMLTADDLAVRNDLEFGGVLRGPEGVLGNITVKEGDITLEDEITSAPFSLVPRRNLIKDHSFEMVPADINALNQDSLNNNWLEIDKDKDIVTPWSFVGNPKVAVKLTAGTNNIMPIMGDQAIVVRNANYGRQYIHDGVSANTQYTVSAHFKRHYNNAPGIPRIEVWHINSSGSRESRIVNSTFDRVKDDYSVARHSTTFTTPTNFGTNDELEIIVSGGDSNWVHGDNIQMVEAEIASPYFNDDVAWLLQSGDYRVKNKMIVLWEGFRYPTANQIVTPLLSLDESMNGWILEWSSYASGEGPEDRRYHHTYIPKMQGMLNSGTSMSVEVPTTGANSGQKYLYVTNRDITGHSGNNSGRAGNSALRRVYEW